MITSDQIKEALQYRGISIPDFEIDAILCLLLTITDCLDSNYEDECVKKTILTWSAVLISSSVAGRCVASQTAPSGASQSFGYGSKPWVSLYNQLKGIDSFGCSSSIVEAPDGVSEAFFGVVTG